jgi:hypothetical protein
MRGNLEDGMHCLQKTSLLGGIPSLRKVDHCKIYELQRCGFGADKKFAYFGMRTIATNSNISRLTAAISEGGCNGVTINTDTFQDFAKLVESQPSALAPIKRSVYLYVQIVALREEAAQFHPRNTVDAHSFDWNLCHHITGKRVDKGYRREFLFICKMGIAPNFTDARLKMGGQDLLQVL